MKTQYFLLKEKYGGKKGLGYLKDLFLLKLGYPVAYLIGSQPFLNITVNLKYKPLIPRPETEFWLKKYVFPEIRFGMKILDIFSGSGCIGLAMAKNFPGTQVILADINPRYVKQIKLNANINHVHNISVIKSDIFENLSGKHNIIVANPPYISKEGDTEIQDSVLKHEDNNSLFASNRGLYFIEKLILESPQYLIPKGLLFIEFDPWQKNHIEKMFHHSKFKTCEFLEDQYNMTRIVKLKMF